MCDDLVRKHARISVLSAIARSCSAAPRLSRTIHSIPARQVEVACRDRSLRLSVAVMEITGCDLEAETVFRKLNAAVPSALATVFLGSSDEVQAVVGKHRASVEPDPMVTEQAWLTARTAIETTPAHDLSLLLQSIDIVVGLQGPWGEVRAFSNPAFPGFVAIGVNSPPAILAEQALHESMHVALAARLALDPMCGPLCDGRVGVLSPFTNSVRTVERVVHGIMSYGVVLAIWKAFGETPSLAALLGLDGEEEASAVCKRRVETVSARLALAELSLRDAAGVDVVEMTRAIFKELTGINGPWVTDLVQSRSAVVSRGSFNVGVGDLNAIERAEVALALEGKKVSRISVPFHRSAEIGFGLLGLGSVAASAVAIRPMRDDRLDGFSNVAEACTHILGAAPSDEVHLYISNEPHLAHSAAVLDRSDEAGELLGIPPCCRARFARRWTSVRHAGGDMFADMLRSHASNGRADVAVECDVSAMYRGGGLCWHFPCSPTCASTIEVVRSRRALFSRTDPELLRVLDSTIAVNVELDSSGRYEVVSARSSKVGCVSFTIAAADEIVPRKRQEF